MVKKQNRQTVRQQKQTDRAPAGESILSRFQSEHVKAGVVLGLSFACLGLSVYSISGGHLDRIAAANYSSNSTVYASTNFPNDFNTTAQQAERPTVAFETESSVNESGSSGAGLQKESNPLDVGDLTDTYDEEAEKQAAEKAAAEKAEQETAKEAAAKAEQQKQLDSMRLRIKPDRDTGNLYYYVVESGDQLSDLAEYFDVPVGQLMEINYIDDADSIYVGEILFMPVDYVVPQAS